MRYFYSRPFLVGLLLVVGAFVAVPLFTTQIGQQGCEGPTPTSPSWDCSQVFSVDFRVPMLLAAGGVVLMLVAAIGMRRRSSG